MPKKRERKTPLTAICALCGKQFQPWRPHQLYCEELHRIAAQNRRARERMSGSKAQQELMASLAATLSRHEAEITDPKVRDWLQRMQQQPQVRELMQQQ
jgi:hypothetical protein